MDILSEAAKMLRPDGVMVYSTCTFNDTENEGVLKRFLQAHPEFSMEPFALSGLPEAPNGWLHLYPHEMRGEGHFVSRLRKSADAPAPQAEMPHMRPARPAKTAGKNAKAPAPPVLPDVFAKGCEPERLLLSG